MRKLASHIVAREEGLDPKHCRIVEAHFFAGRIRAQEARERENDALFKDRLWEEILQREAVTAHFLPYGPRGEKGIDVALALECYDAVALKGLDVVVLVTGDGDFVPLVRKLNARGVRVVVLGFSYGNVDSSRRSYTSRSLLSEATYPFEVSDLIERYAELDEERKELVDGLFVTRRQETEEEAGSREPAEEASASLESRVSAAVNQGTLRPGDRASVLELELESTAQHQDAPASAPASTASTTRQPVATTPPSWDETRQAFQPRRRTSRHPAFRREPPASRQKLERFASQGFSFGTRHESEEQRHPAIQNRDAEVTTGRMTGRVTKVLENYGFIKGDWGESNPFFHKTEVLGDGFDHMQPGTHVSYFEAAGERGTVAKSIQILDDPD
jgi:uncharacterized LabA/DUF88 family protein/cold shock CspA family protein